MLLIVSRYLSRLACSHHGLLTCLAWACCSCGIRHAWHGLVAVFSYTLHGVVVLIGGACRSAGSQVERGRSVENDNRLCGQQEKKSASKRTGCVRTHQAIGRLWTHPGRAHTAPNTKRTGNVNSDAARRGTVHSDAVCQGAVRPDADRHGIVRPDAVGTASAYRAAHVRAFFFWTQACQGISFWTERVRAFSFWMQPCQGISYWTQPCQGIFLLDAAVSGQMASRRCVSWHRGYTGCQGTEHCSQYSRRIRKHAAGSTHSDSVQFYSLYLMYIYICYYHTSRGNKGKLANTTRWVEYDAISTT